MSAELSFFTVKSDMLEGIATRYLRARKACAAPGFSDNEHVAQETTQSVANAYQELCAALGFQFTHVIGSRDKKITMMRIERFNGTTVLTIPNPMLQNTEALLVGRLSRLETTQYQSMRSQALAAVGFFPKKIKPNDRPKKGKNLWAIGPSP